MSRVLGVDFGDRRIGIAVSDEGRRMAFAREAIRHGGKVPEAVELVAALVAAEEAGVVVVGLPLQMDGSRGRQADRVSSFAGLLRRRLEGQVAVTMVDERLTTVAADELLSAAGLHGEERRRRIDAAAAVVILQGWLDGQRAAEGEGG